LKETYTVASESWGTFYSLLIFFQVCISQAKHTRMLEHILVLILDQIRSTEDRLDASLFL